MMDRSPLIFAPRTMRIGLCPHAMNGDEQTPIEAWLYHLMPDSNGRYMIHYQIDGEWHCHEDKDMCRQLAKSWGQKFREERA